MRIVNTMENNRKKLREDLTNEDLAVWFGTKKKPKGSKQPKGPWVNICSKKDGKHPPCGREKAANKSYPKCRAAGVAAKMTDEQKRAACAQKRRVEKTHDKSGKGNKPAMTSYKPKKESIVKTITLKEDELISLIERMINEETNSSSTGSYETPAFLAKNIPNMRQGAKTTYGGKGGKFVKIKSKCRKFPYCSQGAVDDPIEFSNKYSGESTLSGEMELTPTYPKGYKGNTQLTKTKWVNEGLEYSGRDVTKLPIIGRVTTYPIGPYGEGKENVVEIIKGKDGEDIYVTNKWYKEYKRIPLIIHSKLVKEYTSINISEGVKDNVLKFYDTLRDKLYTIYIVGKTLGRFGYNFPSLYRDFKKHKGDKDALLLVTAKYKSELEDYMDDLLKKHPNYEMRRLLDGLTKELKELEDLTLDNFEKTPEKFTKHQQDILLKSYKVTPTGVKRKGIEGDDIDNLREEKIPGGKSSGKSIKDIAKMYKVSIVKAMKELEKGIKVEMEHTNKKDIAMEIAKDHLYEDLFYYDKLKKIEK